MGKSHESYHLDLYKAVYTWTSYSHSLSPYISYVHRLDRIQKPITGLGKGSNRIKKTTITEYNGGHSRISQ